MTNESALPARRALFPKHSTLRTFLLRRGGVFGKDLIRGARICVGLAGAMYVVWTAGLLLRVVGNGANPIDAQTIFQLFLPVLAYILGLGLTGEDEELDTRFFVDRLPAPRLRQLAAKIAAGIVLWFAAAFVCLLLWEILAGTYLGSFAGRYLEAYGGNILVHPRGALWFLTLFFGGLAEGSFFRRNMILAGVVGYAAIMLCQVFLAIAFGIVGSPRGISMNLGHAIGIHFQSPLIVSIPLNERPMLALPITCAFAVALAGWRFATRSEIEEGRLVRAAGAIGRMLPARRRSMDAVAMVNRDVRAWGWRIAIGMGTCTFAANGLFTDNASFWCTLMVLFAASVAYGVLSNPEPEGDQRTFFLHALPLDYHRVVAGRTWRLVVGALATGFLALAGLFIAWNVSATFQPPDPLPNSVNEALASLVLPMVVAPVALALLGHLARFFFHQTVVAFFAASLVGAFWTMVCLAVMAVNDALLPWSLFACVALALAALRIAVRHSLLLELNTGARAAAFGVCMGVLAIWGMFLMTMSPLDVARMVF